jgi:hypothetical protein
MSFDCKARPWHFHPSFPLLHIPQDLSGSAFPALNFLNGLQEFAVIFFLSAFQEKLFCLANKPKPISSGNN